MDFVLIFSFIILRQVTLYLCKPSTIPSYKENKAIISENYAEIVNLLKDLGRDAENNDGTQRTNFQDSKSILHMIQLVNKDGSKAPVAIILTPADLESGGANKKDLQILYEDIKSQKDHEKQMKSREEAFDIKSKNDNETKEELQEILNENVHIPFPENVQQSQIAHDINNHVNLNETPKEETKTENTLESNIHNNKADNLLITNKEDLQIITNEGNVNEEGNNNGKEVKYDDNTGVVIEETNLQTETPLKLGESDDTTEFIKNKTQTLLHDVSRETLMSDNSDEKNSKTIDSLQNTNEPFRGNVLESRNKGTGKYKVYFYEKDKHTEVNSGCDNKVKTSFIDNDCKLDRKIYNLWFIFNR